MARRETAARRYADAAFEIGRADGTLETWERDLAALREALGRRAAAATGRASGRSLRREGEGAATVVERRVAPSRWPWPCSWSGADGPGRSRRWSSDSASSSARERGISLAEVRTALPLDDEQRTAIAERLRALTGDRVEMNEKVDESLIGGISVRIGDRLYDASVRSRLERLRARLTAV